MQQMFLGYLEQTIADKSAKLQFCKKKKHHKYFFADLKIEIITLKHFGSNKAKISKSILDTVQVDDRFSARENGAFFTSGGKWNLPWEAPQKAR